jgi:glycosyltransferase involved in cell wall biosynthesis
MTSPNKHQIPLYPIPLAFPLVSVVIRSMGRETLDTALESIATQTYRHIEVILVDVKGRLELGRSERCGRFPLRTVSTGVFLERSAAANTGLDSAAGDFVIFLDDDDWFMPEHLAALVNAIATADGALASYAGIECRAQTTEGDWQILHVFNQPYDPVRLLVENYLPIHAVLFSRCLLGETLRFDETLNIYEDWDFWIQLSALTDLVHVDQVSAVYRIAQDSGFGLRPADPMLDTGLATLFAKWRSRWSLEQIVAIADSAKYRSMYDELREQGEQHSRQMAAQSRHFDCVNAEAMKVPELCHQIDLVQAEALRLQTQCSLFTAEKCAMEEKINALHERIRADEATREVEREWLNLLGIQTLSDALRCRDDLARFRSLHGRIFETIAAAARGLKQSLRWMSDPLLRLTTHTGHLVKMLQVYGAVVVLRALGCRLRPAGACGSPRLADLWRVLEIEAFDLTPHPRPFVSVLIDPTLPLSEVRRLLEGLAHNHQKIPLEILLLLDADEQSLGSLLAVRLQGIRVIPIDAPRGLAVQLPPSALNQAAGDWLLMISSASVQPSDWLTQLLRTARAASGARIGAVCAKIVGTDGRLLNAGCLLMHDGHLLRIGSGFDPRAPEYNYLRKVHAGSGACLLVNRRAAREVMTTAGADTCMLPDLFDGMHALDWSVLYQPDVSVIVDAAEPDAPSHPALPEDNRRRLLVLDAVMLTPDQDSGSLRMANLLDIFLDLGWHVVFSPSNLEFCEPYGLQLQHRGIEVLYAPLTGSIADFLEQRGASFDLVILSRLDVASAFLDMVRLYAPQAWVWFDTVDLHFLREQREADLRGDPVARAQANQRQRQEIDLMRHADLTLVVSHIERDLLAIDAPDVRVDILSNIHDPHPTDTPFEARDAIVFIGGFNHDPNVDAVLHYAKDILPLVQAELGNVPTYLIGSRPPPEVLALDDPARGLHVVGYIEDVMPYFARARLSIAPLRYGAGVKGKINMSMAYGVPVVATPCAAEGMFLNAETDILIGADARDFAAAVARLYRDQPLWESIARHGLNNIVTHFSRQTARTTLEHLLSERRA